MCDNQLALLQFSVVMVLNMHSGFLCQRTIVFEALPGLCSSLRIACSSWQVQQTKAALQVLSPMYNILVIATFVVIYNDSVTMLR